MTYVVTKDGGEETIITSAETLELLVVALAPMIAEEKAAAEGEKGEDEEEKETE